jgi:hypothetical protein
VFGAPSLFGPSPNISVYSVALMESLLKPAAIGANAKCRNVCFIAAIEA